MGTPSGKLVGRYEIVAEVGRGAMGAVYKAWDPKIERFVALKTILLRQNGLDDQSDFRRRFFVEAQAAGRLLHPGIVTVFDVGEEPETLDPYIVMEYIEGSNLGELLARNTTGLPLDVALQITQEVAEALDYAHAQGVVHRDIKPPNILIPKEGQAKIGDFGIAQLDLSHVTLPGVVLGTPAYMSPEQLEGTQVDGRSDLFSLGAILYTAVTGFNPFQGNSPASVCFKVANREPLQATALAPELPLELDGIIARALAKDPAERYQRGEEFAKDLAELRSKAHRKSALWFSAAAGGRTWLDKSSRTLSAVAGPAARGDGGSSQATPVSRNASAGAKNQSSAPLSAGDSSKLSRGVLAKGRKWLAGFSSSPTKKAVSVFASLHFQTITALALFASAITLCIVQWRDIRTKTQAPGMGVEQVERTSVGDAAPEKEEAISPTQTAIGARRNTPSRAVGQNSEHTPHALKGTDSAAVPEAAHFFPTPKAQSTTKLAPLAAAPVSQAGVRADLKPVALDGSKTAAKAGSVAAVAKTAVVAGADAVTSAVQTPAFDDSSLEIHIANHFAEATLSVWVDDNLAYSQPLHDGHKKRLIVLGGGARDTIKIPLPSGKHELRVQVQSAGEQYDETKTIAAEFPKSGEKTLSISFDKHTRQMVMTFASDQPIDQP